MNISVVARLKDLECEEDRLVQEITNLPERTVVRLRELRGALSRRYLGTGAAPFHSRSKCIAQCDPDVSRRNCDAWWRQSG